MFPVVLSRSKIKPSKYLANILWSESKFKNKIEQKIMSI
jgi:hypothetical protein